MDFKVVGQQEWPMSSWLIGWDIWILILQEGPIVHVKRWMWMNECNTSAENH